MSKEQLQNVSWEEARLLIFSQIEAFNKGIEDLKNSIHQEFKIFKEEFAEANKVKHIEMQNEIDNLKRNQFQLMQKDKENDGKLSGKKAVYAIVGTSIALLVSIGNAIVEIFK
jgi:hypothetical protein